MFTKNEQGTPIELKVLHDFSDQYHAAIDAYLKESGTTAILYRNNLSAIPMVDILERNDVDFIFGNTRHGLNRTMLCWMSSPFLH